MESLSFEAQTALVSFSAAILIGGPVALIGAGRALSVVRLAAGFAMKRQLTTMLGLGLLSCIGAAAGGMIGLPLANRAGSVFRAVQEVETDGAVTIFPVFVEIGLLREPDRQMAEENFE